MTVYAVHTGNEDYECFSSEDIVNKLRNWILTGLNDWYDPDKNDLNGIVEDLLENGTAMFTDTEDWDNVIYCIKLEVQ